MLRTIVVCVAVGVLIPVSAARAEELPTAGGAAETLVEQIAGLIERLDCPAFADRQAASQQLEDAGAAALSQLELAITAGSREAAGRALDILKRHFQQGSDDVKLAAREILERLAQSNIASTAQRARDVLNPPKEASIVSPVGFQPGMPPPRGNVFGGGIAVNAAPFPGGLRRISVSDINGRRVIDIDERERRVIMQTTPGGRIDVEITDKQNGRNLTRKLDARDLDELKRKDAEIGRLFEQYSGTVQRQLGAAGPAAPPFGIGPANPARSPLTPPEIIKQQLESIDTLLERYKQRLPADPAAQRMIDSLEQSKKLYKGMLPAQEATRLVR